MEVAEQLRVFSASCLCDVHVRQLPLDELSAVLRDVTTGTLSADAALEPLERSPYWVCTAMAPDGQLRLVMEGAPRTLEMAQRVVHRVVQV